MPQGLLDAFTRNEIADLVRRAARLLMSDKLLGWVIEQNVSNVGLTVLSQVAQFRVASMNRKAGTCLAEAKIGGTCIDCGSLADYLSPATAFPGRFCLSSGPPILSFSHVVPAPARLPPARSAGCGAKRVHGWTFNDRCARSARCWC